MEKVLILLIILIIVSISLGFLLSRMTYTNQVERGGFFSTETKAVCEEVREPDCYYRCHDEVFLKLDNREVSIYKYDEYVCHDEGWVDPRIKK